MRFSDETLLAYAEGELGEPQRSAVEAAEREDAGLAASIARLRAPPTATVSSLAAARERKARARAPVESATRDPAPRKPLPRWVALVASLAIGVLAGSVWMTAGDPGLVATDADGRLLAGGALAGALSQQLASDALAVNTAAGGRVRIGVSFAARGGGYCRSFSTGRSAGLACREGDSWRIPVLRDAPAESGAAGQGAGTAPAAVLEVIDERIDGMTLDAAAERAARERGWKR